MSLTRMRRWRALEFHRAQILALLVLQRRLRQQAGEADDGVERRADLMAHGRQEGRLGLVGLAGGLGEQGHLVGLLPQLQRLGLEFLPVAGEFLLALLALGNVVAHPDHVALGSALLGDPDPAPVAQFYVRRSEIRHQGSSSARPPGVEVRIFGVEISGLDSGVGQRVERGAGLQQWSEHRVHPPVRVVDQDEAPGGVIDREAQRQRVHRAQQPRPGSAGLRFALLELHDGPGQSEGEQRQQRRDRDAEPDKGALTRDSQRQNVVAGNAALDEQRQSADGLEIGEPLDAVPPAIEELPGFLAPRQRDHIAAIRRGQRRIEIDRARAQHAVEPDEFRHHEIGRRNRAARPRKQMRIDRGDHDALGRAVGIVEPARDLDRPFARHAPDHRLAHEAAFDLAVELDANVLAVVEPDPLEVRPGIGADIDAVRVGEGDLDQILHRYDLRVDELLEPVGRIVAAEFECGVLEKAVDAGERVVGPLGQDVRHRPRQAIAVLDFGFPRGIDQRRQDHPGDDDERRRGDEDRPQFLEGHSFRPRFQAGRRRRTSPMTPTSRQGKCGGRPTPMESMRIQGESGPTTGS